MLPKKREATSGFAEPEVSAGAACQCPVVSRPEKGKVVRVEGKELREASFYYKHP